MFRFFSLIILIFSATRIFAVDTVLVSVSPHRFFVEKIAGNSVNVLLMVPAGSSAHTFEPSPKQMLEASLAKVWFRIGEAFEKKAIAALTTHNPNLRIEDLREGLDMIAATEGGCSCCKANLQDLHFWLSPKQDKIQAKHIAAVLGELYPQNKSLYEKNLTLFLAELDNLQLSLDKMFATSRHKVIMVSHPAYAYFARDFGLTQLPIEFEGKDPTAQKLTVLIEKAKEADIKTVYIQKQYHNKGARLIARELGASVVMLDPYAENVIESIQDIGAHFSQ